MNRTGLHDGDLVAIRADTEPREGKLVVARIDNEVTLKRLRRIDTQTVELHPESHNPVHEPRRVDLSEGELHIDGYVVGALMGRMFECDRCEDNPKAHDRTQQPPNA